MSKINLGTVETGLELYSSPKWKSIQQLSARRLLIIKTQSKACVFNKQVLSSLQDILGKHTLKSLIYTKVLASVQSLRKRHL
jgi:hypothetical protein